MSGTLASRISASSGDLWGGFAAMLVAMPSAIAFGLLIYAPLGPSFAAYGATAGILGTIAIGLVAPAFGGAPRLISAPCAPAAAVMAALALQLTQAQGGQPMSPEQIVLLLTLVGLFSGVLQFAFGTAGGGKLIKYIPYPVVAGYLSGVGILIFISQLPKVFGLGKGVSLLQGLASPSLWQWPSVVVGVVTIVVMVMAASITRAVPAPILGVFGGVFTYLGIGWLVNPELLTIKSNPLLIGSIGGPGSMSLSAIVDRWLAIGNLSFADLERVAATALTLAVLLSIDTLKTCVIVDALTRSRHNSNRELIGQGLGNIASAVVGGMPGAGTMGATLVNLNSGGITRLSGVLEGVFALLVFLLLADGVAWVPIAALAGILLVIAVRMVDPNIFHLLRQRSTIFDFVVVAAVVVTAVTYNLIAAAGVGLALAILLFLREQIRSSVIRRKVYGNQIFSKRRRLPGEIAVLEQQGRQTTICELQGSLFFGTTDQLFSELEQDLKTSRYVILDMRRVQSVDFTAAHMLEQIEGRLAERKGLLIFSHLPPNLPTGQDLQSYFDQVGLVKPSRSIRIFENLDEALEWTEEQTLEEHHMARDEEDPPLDLAEIDLVKGFTPEAITALRGCAEARSIEPGQKAFAQGDTGDEIYLIRRGSVRIVLTAEGGKPYHLVTFARGDFFGDLAFIDRGMRSANAIAETRTDLYVISRSRYDAVAMQDPALDKKFFWRLARSLGFRLRQTDAELRALHDA